MMESTAARPILVLEDVEKSFGEVRAVVGVSLVVLIYGVHAYDPPN